MRVRLPRRRRESHDDDPWHDIVRRYRRRRAIGIGALCVALALIGFGIARLLSPSDGPQRRGGGSTQARTQRAGKQKPRSRLSPQARAAARLPLHTQVAQLFMIGFSGAQPNDPGVKRALQRPWGGFVLDSGNYSDPTQLAALTGSLLAAASTSHRQPPLIAAAQEGGGASAFAGLPPRSQQRIGTNGQSSLARSEALRAARKLQSLGVNMTLAPVADVGTPGGALEARVFGDESSAVARMVSAAAAGYQSQGMIAAVGHFPGSGAATQDPDVAQASVGLTLPDLMARDIRPFMAIADRVPVVVMSNAAYAAYDGVTPAVLLPKVIEGLLRKRLKFAGVVMSDDLAATTAATGGSVSTAAVAAVRAGTDLLYVRGAVATREAAYAAILQALRQGKLSRDRVAEAAGRVLALKRRYRLSSNKPPKPPPTPTPTRPATPGAPGAKP
ncbi:MAG TPA: glycoside hydrolase family 3 N-terminal domain-containing protein [Solirubrobacteraceae bacterium]|nr:glycoside hydrolase family 3 N-terminal domain-containing protein [Solirubrobacteraceae bacterium]